MNDTHQELRSPASGRCIPVSQAENPALRNKTFGDGVAIYPINGAIHAPCDGRITEISPTGNTIKITTEHGAELLLMLGMDTDELGGQGFRTLVHQGNRVSRGQKITTMNIDMIETEGYDITIALLISNMSAIASIKPTRADVNANKDIVLKYNLKD